MNIRFSFLSLLELTHIFPWCDSKLPFKHPKQVIIVSKSTYFIDFRHRISLFQKPFAQIQLRFDNILMNGDSCLPFKFSGNMIFTDKKFLFQTFQ